MEQRSPKIRALTAADFAAVARLLAEGDRLHQPFDTLRITQGDTQPITRDDYRSFLPGDDTFAVGVFLGSELDGFLRAVLIAKPAGRLKRAMKLVRIEEIVVREPQRRTGLGRRLMDAARDWARDSGAERLELDVYDANRAAVAFYEKLGFQTVQRTMRFDLQTPARQG